MSLSLYDFRVVTPASLGFSAAEARVGKTYIKFNNLAAAELHYPDYIRLLIGKDGSTLVIQACERGDPNSVPFMCGRTADDITGKKSWIVIRNRMLGVIINEKAHWDSPPTATSPKRFFAVPWREQNALIFDLMRPAAPRKRSVPMSADEILSTYEAAAKADFIMPVTRQVGNVIDAQFTTI